MFTHKNSQMCRYFGLAHRLGPASECDGFIQLFRRWFTVEFMLAGSYAPPMPSAFADFIHGSAVVDAITLRLYEVRNEMKCNAVFSLESGTDRV